MQRRRSWLTRTTIRLKRRLCLRLNWNLPRCGAQAHSPRARALGRHWCWCGRQKAASRVHSHMHCGWSDLSRMLADVQGLSVETFRAFPADRLDSTWIMVPAQEAHAKAILEQSKNVRDIRFKLCPSQLRDEVSRAQTSRLERGPADVASGRRIFGRYISLSRKRTGWKA